MDPGRTGGPRCPRARGIAFRALVLVLLAPAVLLGAVRLVEPEGGWAIRLTAFTPLGIPLLVTLLVVLAIAGLRGPRRALLVVPTLVTVLLLGLHVWWFSPRVLGANPPAARGAETITVMTSNLFEGRGEAISLVREASDAGVDILVVEEITPGALTDMERVGLNEVFPHRIGAPGDSIEGTMVFARQELGEPTRLPTVFGSWEVSVGDLRLMAVHPSAPMIPDAWREDHAVILAAARDSAPDLIVGDFNATDDHLPMRALADAGYRDVAELANEGWQPTWPANGLYHLLGIALPPLTGIDHVLVGRTLAGIGTRTVTLDGTDHKVLIAEVALK